MHVLDRRLEPEGDLLLAAASVNCAVYLWDFAPFATESNTGSPRRLPHEREVLACAFRHVPGGGGGDADLLLTACADGTLRLWDIDNEVVIRALTVSGAALTSCTFSPHGNQVVAGRANGALALYDTHTGRPMRTMASHLAAVTDIACLPDEDGRLLSASADGTVHVWEVRSPTT